MSPLKRFLGAWFFPAVLVLIGGLSLWLGISDMANGWASRNWPSVQGTIVASSIGINTSSSNNRQKAADTSYSANVEYTFSVDGNDYSGHRISFGEYASADRAEAERFLIPYREGQNVAVYYDPDSHRKAVLEPGLHGYPWLFLLPGVLFSALGIFMARFFPKASS